PGRSTLMRPARTSLLMASADASPLPRPTPLRPGRVFDPFLAALVVAFAFLAASFAARNSDLWVHLASGPLLARGDYPFGHDLFAYTTDGVYWANHAWLLDLGLYGFYAGAGGTLVVLKAAAVALLAWLLIRAGGGGWAAAVCAALAVLAMSPRL